MSSTFDGSQRTPSISAEPIITPELYAAAQEILRSKPRDAVVDRPSSPDRGAASPRTAPLGYDRVVDESTGKATFVVNEEEAQKVRKIFDDYLHGSEEQS